MLNFTQSLQLEYADSQIRIQVVLPGPVRTEFFSSQGVSDDVFPAESFLTAEQLVDAALAALASNERVTVPSMRTWTDLEAARLRFMEAAFSGEVAPRYAASDELTRRSI